MKGGQAVMTRKHFLTAQQTRDFYDRMGRRQDWQRLYEGRAIAGLLRHGAFGSARKVFELGCGTGALAKTLLSQHLPAEARYVGVDISPVMVGLAQQRLAPFGERVRVFQSDGTFDFSRYVCRCDRFVAAYVLDLLSPTAICQLLAQAHAILKPNAKLCLISLTEGCTPLSRTVMWLRHEVR